MKFKDYPYTRPDLQEFVAQSDQHLDVLATADEFGISIKPLKIYKQ